MAAKKCTKIVIKAKQANHFGSWEKGRNKIQKVLLQKYDNHVSVQDKQMLLKGIILWHSMVCYTMLSYALVWYEKYGMLCNFYAMLWDFYAMVYVVKDKHSATGTCWTVDE